MAPLRASKPEAGLANDPSPFLTTVCLVLYTLVFVWLLVAVRRYIYWKNKSRVQQKSVQNSSYHNRESEAEAGQLSPQPRIYTVTKYGAIAMLKELKGSSPDPDEGYWGSVESNDEPWVKSRLLSKYAADVSVRW